jgi:hypothetical protein
LNNNNNREEKMLSVTELCNNVDEILDEGNRSPVRHGSPKILVKHEKEEDQDRAYDQDDQFDENTEEAYNKNEEKDDRWSDHNRWYCNICKV